MKNLLSDILRGALPLSQIPGFIAWAIGKTFYFWFAVILAAAIIILSK